MVRSPSRMNVVLPSRVSWRSCPKLLDLRRRCAAVAADELVGVAGLRRRRDGRGRIVGAEVRHRPRGVLLLLRGRAAVARRAAADGAAGGAAARRRSGRGGAAAGGGGRRSSRRSGAPAGRCPALLPGLAAGAVLRAAAGGCARRTRRLAAFLTRRSGWRDALRRALRQAAPDAVRARRQADEAAALPVVLRGGGGAECGGAAVALRRRRRRCCLDAGGGGGAAVRWGRRRRGRSCGGGAGFAAGGAGFLSSLPPAARLAPAVASLRPQAMRRKPVAWNVSSAVPASKSVATAFLGKREFILIWSPDVQCDALSQSQRAMCGQSKALQCNWFPRREINLRAVGISERPFIEARSCGPARARCPRLRR